ncbi:TPA: hypothetical protein EYP66_14655 [Candidatus Poribacteria bacterium]|nr:hypothetical protein [Candidatus Poribacteria bacterium]
MAVMDFGSLVGLVNGVLFPNFRYPIQETSIPSQYYLQPFSEIWIGDSRGNVANAYDAVEDGIGLGEFQPTERGAPMYVTDSSVRQEIIAQYSTQGESGEKLPFEILVDQHTFSWNGAAFPEAKDFIIMKLTLTNLRTIDVDDIYIAIAADWNVSGGKNDLVGWDESRQASVVFDAGSPPLEKGGRGDFSNPINVALVLLEGKFNAHRIVPADAWTYRDENRSILMSTKVTDTFQPTIFPPGDYITVISAGTYNIQARNTKSVIFAFVAGRDLDELNANIDTAQRLITLPDMLTAEPSDGTIRIAWRPAISEKVLAYKVYRSNKSGGGYVQVGPRLIPGAAYEDTGLLNGARYYYIVKAVDASEQEFEFYSKEVSAIPDKKPEPPKNLWANIIGGATHLSWIPSVGENIIEYNIFRNLTGEEPWTPIGSVNSPQSSFTDENIHPNITYYYTVTAVKASGMQSEFAEFVTAQIDEPPSNLPQNNLNKVIVAPNPYNPSTNGQDGIKFLNLTPKATIRIYNSTGEVVKILEHIDETGIETWDAKNDAGETVTSGIYVYYVTAFTDGREELKAHGKFAIVR